MRRVTCPCDCHLIPKVFNVSQKIVRLDGPFDHAIGSRCDSEIKRFIELLFASSLGGRSEFIGGAKSVKSTFDLVTQSLRIHRGKRDRNPEWFRHVSGSHSSQVSLKEFHGNVVDTASALASVIHSAFLVLHHQKYLQIYEPEYDSIRMLLQRASRGELLEDDLHWMQETIDFAVYFRNDGRLPLSIPMSDLRTVYDPEFSADDEVDSNFPRRSATAKADSVLVTVPYSKCIRATVTFPAMQPLAHGHSSKKTGGSSNA